MALPVDSHTGSPVSFRVRIGLMPRVKARQLSVSRNVVQFENLEPRVSRRSLIEVFRTDLARAYPTYTCSPPNCSRTSVVSHWVSFGVSDRPGE